jgi:hypothetical protein
MIAHEWTVQATHSISLREPSDRSPLRLNHSLRRNNYPDIVFNLDRSYALEAAGLPFTGDDCFPCDPGRATCNTLHFFHHFFEMFISDAGTAGKDLLPVHISGKTQVPVLNRTPAKIRSMTSCVYSAGDLRELPENPFRHRLLRLPITKKSVE